VKDKRNDYPTEKDEKVQMKFLSLRKDNGPNKMNETNKDYIGIGEHRGFNSVYIGGVKETISIQRLKQCMEENFGRVRFIRIIRDKVIKTFMFILHLLHYLYNISYFFFPFELVLGLRIHRVRRKTVFRSCS